MHPTLTIAKRALYSAEKIITKAFEQLGNIKIADKLEKSDITDIEIAVEQEIINVVSSFYPEHSFSCKHSGDKEGTNNDYLWVINPLCGTTNFLKGFPHFAISIAIYIKGKLEVGLVYNPINDEMFIASRGDGAMLNDRRIRCSSVSIEDSIIATGFPCEHKSLMPIQLSYIRDGLNLFSDIRRTGSTALDLCYTASGRVDGFFELGLNKWDIAAGTLIAQESGVIISDVNGEMTHLDSGNIVAAPSKIYKKLINILRK